MPAAARVWVRHPKTGWEKQIPAKSLPAYQRRGFKQFTPPPPDPAPARKTAAVQPSAQPTEAAVAAQQPSVTTEKTKERSDG